MGSLSTGINKQLVLVFPLFSHLLVSCVSLVILIIHLFCQTVVSFDFFFYDDDLFFELVSKPFVFFEIQ